MLLNLLPCLSFLPAQTHISAQRQIYVLVIGETLRPDRLQLNGYNRATTPRLSGTKNRDQLHQYGQPLGLDPDCLSL